MWEYRGKVAKVVDADTVDVTLDLGFKIYHEVRLRLARIDAPELSTEEGKKVRDYVVNLLPLGAPVVVKTGKGDRYGRWIAELSTADGVNVSDTLLAHHLAAPYP
jgi:endonuclease YncB( thermonuclease family)